MDRWTPNRGPQLAALRSRCFEILYGGSAGGGKTDALLAGAARFIDRRRYRAVLARRTVPELEGSDGLIERSHDLYPPLGGVYEVSRKRWHFSSGAKIVFISCENEQEVRRFSGWQYQFLGVDELTTFTRRIHEFLISRLRTTTDIPCLVRATSNPGGPGHDWVLDRFRWWLYREGVRVDEFGGPYLGPGTLAFVRRDPESGKDTLCEPGQPGAQQRMFIPALLRDNPQLAATDYGERLKLLDPLTRRQLEEGDWMARAEPGMFWDRAWITTRLERPPAMPMARLRYWDLGGTEDSRGRDPAYTAGVLMSVQRDGLVIVEDVARCRKDPGGVEEFFGEIAGADAARFGGVEQFIEQDPGQAGKFEISAFQTRFPQHDIGCWRPTGDKVTRFKPFSAMASRGKVGMVIGRWNGAYHDELEGFPPLTRKGKADQADASSGAFEQLQRGVHVPARAGGVREMRRAVGGF